MSRLLSTDRATLIVHVMPPRAGTTTAQEIILAVVGEGPLVVNVEGLLNVY